MPIEPEVAPRSIMVGYKIHWLGKITDLYLAMVICRPQVQKLL
jgi:hypothetical protein